MCNAYTLTHSRDAITELTRAMQLKPENELEEFEPRYRIGTKQRAPILIRQDGRLLWRMALWGLLSSAKKQKYPLNNARADKLNGWPWSAFLGNRCLAPASGFFEPEKPAGSKVVAPWHYYSLANKEPFFMLGLWSETIDPETGEVEISFTIVIIDANAAIREHNRMPATSIGAPVGDWVTKTSLPRDLLTPCAAEHIVGWRVGDAVKNSRTPNSPDLVRPVADQPM